MFIAVNAECTPSKAKVDIVESPPQNPVQKPYFIKSLFLLRNLCATSELTKARIKHAKMLDKRVAKVKRLKSIEYPESQCMPYVKPPISLRTKAPSNPPINTKKYVFAPSDLRLSALCELGRLLLGILIVFSRLKSLFK